MSRRKNSHHSKKSSQRPPRASSEVRRSSLPGWKLWAFRLVAMVFVSTLLLGCLEVTLRLIGFGYPTSFLLPAQTGGRQVWKQNDRYGWRFFGRALSREPLPLCLDRAKPANTIRVFIFGESAAYGDPQVAFGLPRMLETFLKLRYPSTRFEMVNAAMTGINSHVVRDIARDCAKANGDLWVIYMGNNEVVGPFGAGTVFSRQTPPLSFIRASLALKTTRLGQLLDAASQRLHSSSNVKSEWNGMAMFLDKEVRADDPRMNRVYDHFQENLADIIATGRRAGAGVVVSTIAVNMKDCAPFASAQLPALDGSLKLKWQAAYDQAIRAQNLGDPRAELQALDEAAQVDDTVAELHFRRGECAFRLGDEKMARVEFKRARDLDALRFRCDGRMNEIIRTTAASHQVAFADAESIFAKNSADGLPGNELFYDHVHPT